MLNGYQKLLEKYFIGNEVLEYIKQLEKEKEINIINSHIEQIKQNNIPFIQFLEKKIKKSTKEYLRNIKEVKEFFYNNLHVIILKDKSKYKASIFRASNYTNNLPLTREIIHITKEGDFIYKDEEKVRIDAKTFIFNKKPKLQIPKNISYEIDLKINMALPEKELIDYISKLKQQFDKKNLILKLPVQNLEETLHEAIVQKGYPKKPTASKMADMFFIYDYVTARNTYIKNENIAIKEEYDTKIFEISKDYELSTKEKKIQKTETTKEYLENTIDTKITDIFNEDEITKALNLSSSNISKLYYAIKPYIKDLKYKELITGVSII